MARAVPVRGQDNHGLLIERCDTTGDGWVLLSVPGSRMGFVQGVERVDWVEYVRGQDPVEPDIYWNDDPARTWH